MDYLVRHPITIIATYLGNIYAGIATIPALNLSSREMTILGIVLGLSHNLFVETGILINLNFATIRIAFFRVFVSLFIGLILNLLLPENIPSQILNPFLKHSTTSNWSNIIIGILTTILQILNYSIRITINVRIFKELLIQQN